jgi:murein DD-endopeptidase MepM/ murein hydrolase activator NlpD
LRAVTLCLSTILAAAVLTLVLDRLFETPQELALKVENEALREHITSVNHRIERVQADLDRLETTDAELYRALLGADPISSDERRVGVGGAAVNGRFAGFSLESAEVLSRSAESINHLERRVALQNASFRKLTALVEKNRGRVAQTPAILPTDGPIVSGFGMRMHPILNIIRPHRGIDIVVPVGSKVVAPADGVVTVLGRGLGLGRYVRLSHPDAGYETTFAHLSRIEKTLKRGLRVRRGDVIGYSGNTGLSRAPHLHYEVRNAERQALDPMHFVAPGMTPEAYERAREQVERSSVSID